MGIQGLLPQLKGLTKSTNIGAYRNKRLAIDGYAWLHKAVYGCCLELATGKETLQWVNYCIAFIDMLLHNDIEVFLVFDGANLPAKQSTEEGRADNRAQNLKTGLGYLQKNDFSNARTYLSRAVDVTPRMAARLIHILRQKRPTVRCIVAPFEADAQLAYLCRNNIVDAVISEDSDTIPYGCTEVLFKLDREGFCQTIRLDDL
jgi:exonuclease-1